MKTTEVTDGIFRLSANMEDILFEGVWPIPNGVAMNSYIVKGEKAAIVDGVCNWDGVPETLYEQLDQMNVKLEEIDYVIINHMEPDHSGWIENFKKIRPEFTIYTTEKAKVLLEAFYGITDNVHTVKDGDTLDLGGGRVLSFYEAPNVHWPETMVTFDSQTGTLLPCDAFGSYGSVGDSPYDDMLSEDDLDFFEEETLRYYANIVAAFSVPVEKALNKLGGLPIKIIAPGHGIVWRKDPGRIIQLYKKYSDYRKGPAETEITLIFGSMYGNTEKAVEAVKEGVEREGVKLNVHRVPEDHVGFILATAWKSSGLILGMPTYEYKMFPPMAHVLDDFKRKKFMGKKCFRFGSYGWSGGAEKELQEITNGLKWDFLESVEFKGAPSEEDLKLIADRSQEIAKQVKEYNLEKMSAEA
jgi:anaerobic nitric oxide reductase flavorubredoxin